jgi:hypothetical protein
MKQTKSHARVSKPLGSAKLPCCSHRGHASLFFLIASLLTFSWQLAEGADSFEYNKVAFNFSSPSDFERIDQGDSPFAVMARMTTPESNALLAAYILRKNRVSASNLDGNVTPYFLIQVGKETSAGKALNSKQMAGFFDAMSENLSTIFYDDDAARLRQDAKANLAAAMAHLKIEGSPAAPTMITLGVSSRSDRHLTILVVGTQTIKKPDASYDSSLLASITIMNVGGFPVFLYVYSGEPSEKALSELVELTDQVRSGFKGKH